MAEITGRERVKSAYKRTFVDRLPFYPIAGSFTAQLGNHTLREYLTDSGAFIESQMAFYRQFKPDVVVILSDLLLEAEAMGATLHFPEQSMCEVASYPLADKAALSKLGVPDPESDGRMPYFLETCRAITPIIQDSAVGSTICGPWAIAGALRGVEALIYDTMDDPAFVHELMTLTTSVVSTFASAVRDAGVGISLSEAPTSCSLISPDIYRQFIDPYYRQLVEAFKEKKTGLTIHICGFIDPIMEDICDCGFSAISIDSPSSLRKMVEINRGRSVIIGNVATSFFSDARLDDIEKAIVECIDIAAAHSGYILASGCELPPMTTVETLSFFMETADRLCRQAADTHR